MWKLTLGFGILNIGTQIPGSIYLWSWKRDNYLFFRTENSPALI
jgi:hypothetical protein